MLIQRHHLLFLVAIGTLLILLALALAMFPGHAHGGLPAPGPERIVFSRHLGSGRSGIFSMKPDGSDVVPLTSGNTNDWGPAISPDGRQIAFVRQTIM